MNSILTKDLMQYEINRSHHKCFDSIIDLLVATSGLITQITIMNGYDRKDLIPSKLDFYCLSSKQKVRISSISIVKSVMVEKWPSNIKLSIIDVPGSGQDEQDVIVDSLACLSERLALGTFCSFFETNRNYIEGVGPCKQINDWPEVWRFGWVVRNALGHGGFINIRDQTLRPVSWKGISISYENYGQQLMHSILAVGDIILLMLDMEEFLHSQ